MAIEAVFSLGLSLIVAIAAIGVFGDYRSSVIDTIEERHASVIKSQVATSIYNLKEADSGSSITLDLPSTNQREYRVSLNDEEFALNSGGTEYRMDLNGLSWVDEFQGSATGPTVKIVKLDNDIVVRSG